jgi:hypothetical protein
MSDLDELLARDALDLSSQDIDALIGYYRNIRVKKARGEKPEKIASASIDISEITKKLVRDVKPAQTFRRI